MNVRIEAIEYRTCGAGKRRKHISTGQGALA